jgi:hypothetical protein
MIFCGSGFDFGKVLVPVPALVIQKQKKLHKILPFQCIRSRLFSRKLASLFYFFYFFTFYVACGSKSGSGTEIVMHSGSGSRKAKSYGSCGFGSGSTTLQKRNIIRCKSPPRNGKLCRFARIQRISLGKNETLIFVYSLIVSFPQPPAVPIARLQVPKKWYRSNWPASLQSEQLKIHI